MRVLSGDIGGTKTLLSLSEIEAGAPREVDSQRFDSAGFDDLLSIVTTFLGPRIGGRAFDAAAFAIAGPVVDGRCKTTNLPWLVDERALAAALGAPVRLVNDFAAVVLGIPELAPADLVTLQSADPEPDGLIAVLGAGTGLGEAIGIPTPRGLRPQPTEGGHTHFAPRDEVEQRLLSFLRAEIGGRVSVERVVSGPGLHDLYRFAVADGIATESESVRGRMAREDPSAVIAEMGDGRDAACSWARDRFVSLYGAEAGDFALKVLPTGGLYVAGGIAPKLLPALRGGDFIDAYLDKGRMGDVLRRIPVAVVTNPQVGLLGARAQACMIV